MPPAKKKNQEDMDAQDDTPNVKKGGKGKKAAILLPPPSPAAPPVAPVDPLKKVLSAPAAGMLGDLFAKSQSKVDREGEEDDAMESIHSDDGDGEEDTRKPVATVAPVVPREAKVLRVSPATKISEQYGRVLTGPIGQLFDQVKEDEPASTALLEAMVNLQIVPEGETKVRLSEVQQLREQLAVANRNVVALRVQVDTSKQQLRDVTAGAIKCFQFTKTDGAVGKISEGSVDKITASNDRLERVSILLAGAKDNHSLAEALRGYVKSIS